MVKYADVMAFDMHPFKRYPLCAAHINGYHRLVEALMSGRTSVHIKNAGPAEWRPPSANELFIPDWDQDYFGMEDFIEHYELRRLG